MRTLSRPFQRRQAAVAGGVVLIVIGVWLIGLRQDDDPFSYTLGVFQELRRRTTPPGASVSMRSEPRTRKWSVQVEWQLETELSWRDYSRWLRERLDEPDFKLLGSSDTMLRYSRQLRADRHLLEFRLVTQEPPIRVAITLVTSPS